MHNSCTPQCRVPAIEVRALTVAAWKGCVRKKTRVSELLTTVVWKCRDESHDSQRLRLPG